MSKYSRTIRSCNNPEQTLVDVYSVLDAFGVTCPATQHAIKKTAYAGPAWGKVTRGRFARSESFDGSCARHGEG